MIKNELLISKNVLYALIALGFLFNFFRISFDTTSLGIPLMLGNIFAYLGLFSSFIATIVLIVDVFKNNVNGKYLWTIAFLFSGGLIGFFYLRSRDYYLKSSSEHDQILLFLAEKY